MKPNMKINEVSPQNREEFRNGFFDRFPLRPMPEPLRLSDAISRQYQFPTFYGDVTCAIGIFLCSWEKAHAMMLHPDIKPVRMPGGRSLVIFSCYQYKKVHEVGCYNEIAMTIPILVKPTINVPLLPMLMQGLFKKFGYYVFGMPVTSLENQIRGEKIWGLPKVVHEIDIADDGDDCVTTGRDEDGKTYMTLRVPRSGKNTHFDVCSNLYSRKGDELLQSQTCFKADFAMNKYMNRLFKSGGTPQKDWLTLGDSPYADRLRALHIDPNPFQFRYAEGMSACFDLANDDYKSPIKF